MWWFTSKWTWPCGELPGLQDNGVQCCRGAVLQKRRGRGKKRPAVFGKLRTNKSYRKHSLPGFDSAQCSPIDARISCQAPDCAPKSFQHLSASRLDGHIFVPIPASGGCSQSASIFLCKGGVSSFRTRRFSFPGWRGGAFSGKLFFFISWEPSFPLFPCVFNSPFCCTGGPTRGP